MGRLSISVFFPCYNDAPTIGGLVIKVDRVLRRISKNFEIIVVNDGSTDKSDEVLENVKKKIPGLRVVTHRKNRGYGAALSSGFKAATKDFVFYTDGDGQYDVAELSLLFDCLTADIDVVNGIKMERSDSNLRILVGNAYMSIVRNLFSLPLYDVDCDFRLIRNKLMKGVTLTITSGAVCVELVKKLQNNGARFREVTVHHYPRRFGQSQFFKPTSLLATAWDLITLWFRL